MNWISRSRKLTISRSSHTILLKLVHFLHFHYISRVEAFGSALHFWWNPFAHTLHLTRMVLEHKAATHLAHFSLEFLASARDMPWFKSEFNDGGAAAWGWSVRLNWWMNWWLNWVCCMSYQIYYLVLLILQLLMFSDKLDSSVN